MVKKSLLAILVLAGLWFCQMTGVCFADASGDYEQAEGHRINGDYFEAEQVYKTIVEASAATKESLFAQRGLALLYILTQRSFDAEEAIDKLTTDFVEYSEPNDVAQALFDIARQYEWSAKYEEAKNVFARITQHHANSWYVTRTDLAVPRTHIMGLIASGKYEEAQTAVNKLMANSGFHKHMDFPETLYSIGKRYEWSHKYEEAMVYYMKLMQQYPDSPAAGKVPLNARRTAISFLIESGNEVQTEAEINKLTADFSGQPALPGILYDVAEKYEWSFKFGKARSLYQRVIQQYPDSPQVDNARLGVAKTDILLLISSGEDAAALTAINKLIVDFSEHPGLAIGVSWIGEQYQIKAARLETEGSAGAGQVRDCTSKAIAIWKKVINQLQDPIAVPEACHYVGDCYRKLGKYLKSAEYYQKVVDDYPGYRIAWHCLFMVGRNYEDLKKAGTVSESEADAKIKVAYEQVIEKYPDCKAATAAQSWLDRNNSK